jgi:hypothetical protein
MALEFELTRRVRTYLLQLARRDGRDEGQEEGEEELQTEHCVNRIRLN